MSLKQNVIVNYLGQGWAALMGIAFVPLYIQALGVESFGLIGVFAILQAWVGILDLGLTPTLNREMARLRAGAHSAASIRDLLRSLEFVYAALAVVMVLVVWGAAPAMGTVWLKAEQLPLSIVIDSIRVMGFVLAMRWLEQIYRGALQGLQDFVWLNAAHATLSTLRWGGAYVVVAFFSPTVEAFFYWQGAVSLMTVAVLIHRTYLALPPAGRRGHFDVDALRSVMQFAGGMFLGSVLALLLTQTDKVVVSKLLTLEQLGYYMLAATAAGGLMQLITPMNTAIFPRLTEHAARDDHAALAATFLRSCQWMAAIIVPPALLLAAFSQPLLLLWSGNPALTREAAPLLALLALGTLCNGLMNLPYMLQLAHGWTSLAVRVNLVAVLLIVPSILWAVPRYGAVGAAGAWLVLNAGYLLVGAHLMYVRLLPDVKWQWYRQAVFGPLLAGGVACAVVRALLPEAESRTAAAVTVLVALVVLTLAVGAALPDPRQALRGMVRGLLDAKSSRPQPRPTARQDR